MKKKDQNEINPEIQPLQEKIDNLEKQMNEYVENWKRERADFVNYKNNEAKRVEEIVKYSSEGLVIEILDIMDGLDMALAHVPADIKEKHASWLEGLEGVSRNMEKLLSRYSIEKIKVEGEKFDPSIHEVVGIEEQGGENIAQVRSGYKMFDKVIRPARVKIIK
jgi:molecular chaperone GrpE